MKTIIGLSLGALSATSILMAHEPVELPEGYPEMPELEARIHEIGDRVGSLMASGWMAVDEDGDGRVPLKTVLKSLMGKGFARVNEGPVPEEAAQQGGAEAYHRRMAEMDKTIAQRLKGDESGMIGKEEAIELFETAIYEFMINRNAVLDINKDTKLTLEEYATGFPIREGEEADDEGYTKNQREGFANQDPNKDGVISSDEWISPMMVHFMEELAEISTITLWIDRLDADSDGSISKAELAVALPNAGDVLPESIPLRSAIAHIRALPHELHKELAAALLPTS
ncbi:MAG: hypothetical protein AAGB46_11875 [Verrucomicrobiota bacterium]